MNIWHVIIGGVIGLAFIRALPRFVEWIAPPGYEDETGFHLGEDPRGYFDRLDAHGEGWND